MTRTGKGWQKAGSVWNPKDKVGAGLAPRAALDRLGRSVGVDQWGAGIGARHARVDQWGRMWSGIASAFA